VLSFVACPRARLVCHELRVVIRPEDIGKRPDQLPGFLQGL
jgi:hypothetical protein